MSRQPVWFFLEEGCSLYVKGARRHGQKCTVAPSGAGSNATTPFQDSSHMVSLNADMVEPVPYWSAKCNVRVYRCAFNRCQLVGRLERSCESTSKRDLVGKVHVVLHLHDLCYVACCLLRSGRAPGPLHHAPYDQLNAGVLPVTDRQRVIMPSGVIPLPHLSALSRRRPSGSRFCFVCQHW